MEWFHFEEKTPDPGQKIIVIGKIQFKGIWTGKEVIKEHPNEPVETQVIAYWAPSD